MNFVMRRRGYALARKMCKGDKGMTYGYCVYHEIECDYKGTCIDCPHNTEEDVEWFKQDEKKAESEDEECINH